MRREMETMMIMDSSKPLYLQVEADIKNRILSKQYMPGDKLPTENELSDQYNVSKITIRKAIRRIYPMRDMSIRSRERAPSSISRRTSCI